MTDKARQFERFVLRPVQLIFLILAVSFLFKGMWWWMGGCILGLLYLGIVGSKLHPLQSATDLAKGPLEGSAAQIESELLPPQIKQILVGYACTRVGILMSMAMVVIAWKTLGWQWYISSSIGLSAAIISGAILKLVFKTENME